VNLRALRGSCHLLPTIAINKTSDSSLEMDDVEIDQQSDVNLRALRGSCHLLPTIAINKTSDSSLEMDDVEIDQQSDGFPAELKIRDYLRLMHGRDRLD
jgi:hypothetical protein